MIARQVSIPNLVRIKPGALDRLGIYAERYGFERVAFLYSEGLPEPLLTRATRSLDHKRVRIVDQASVADGRFEGAYERFKGLPSGTQAVIGLGGGKALDVAKYIAFLARLPFVSVPGSLSNDGFCSPQSSLTVEGRRRSLPSAMPFGVVLDTEVCLAAPEALWLSGIGDLVAKFTAVADWKLAFHARGTPVDDFSALLSDATVLQFQAHPKRDLDGVRLLGTALMLNGIAMGISGSSRPASGSEHLLSHALDSLSARPRLHGIQVGVAAYLVSLLQGEGSAPRPSSEGHGLGAGPPSTTSTRLIGELLERTGFWNAVRSDPFCRREWLEAARRAPSIKQDFYTVLSSRDCLPEIEHHLNAEPRLKTCFTDPP